MVMAPLLSQKSMVGRVCPKPTEVTKQEAQISECFLGALRKGVVFGLLGAEAYIRWGSA